MAQGGASDRTKSGITSRTQAAPASCAPAFAIRSCAGRVGNNSRTCSPSSTSRASARRYLSPRLRGMDATCAQTNILTASPNGDCGWPAASCNARCGNDFNPLVPGGKRHAIAPLGNTAISRIAHSEPEVRHDEAPPSTTCCVPLGRFVHTDVSTFADARVNVAGGLLSDRFVAGAA